MCFDVQKIWSPFLCQSLLLDTNIPDDIYNYLHMHAHYVFTCMLVVFNTMLTDTSTRRPPDNSVSTSVRYCILGSA